MNKVNYFSELDELFHKYHTKQYPGMILVKNSLNQNVHTVYFLKPLYGKQSTYVTVTRYGNQSGLLTAAIMKRLRKFYIRADVREHIGTKVSCKMSHSSRCDKSIPDLIVLHDFKPKYELTEVRLIRDKVAIHPTQMSFFPWTYPHHPE